MTSALDTRDGVGYVSSRIGMKRPAIAIEETTDIFGYIRDLSRNTLLCVGRWSPVSQASPCLRLSSCCWWARHTRHDFWLKNDFRNELFEGSKYLLLLADKIDEIKTICPVLQEKATMVLRTQDGLPVYDGEQIQIGGNETYISVCRKHYFAPEINKENQ